MQYLVDSTDSGSGSLQISISRDGKNIPNYVQNEGGVRYRINFTPDQPYPHHVQIKFNGIIINGIKKFRFYIYLKIFLLNRITFYM